MTSEVHVELKTDGNFLVYQILVTITICVSRLSSFELLRDEDRAAGEGRGSCVLWRRRETDQGN